MLFFARDYGRFSTTVVLVWKLAIGKLRNYQTPLPAHRFLKPNLYKYNCSTKRAFGNAQRNCMVGLLRLENAPVVRLNQFISGRNRIYIQRLSGRKPSRAATDI
jgi:hypothetical protein